MKFFNYKRVPYAEIRAFSVHILTASGSFLAFLGVVAAAEKDFVAMFWWLGLALFVDGIDGPIARKVRVKEVLPNWSGDTLDNIIDYVTYVLLPAFALYQSDMIGEPWSFVAAGAIVVSSAIYYADIGMKTDEYFFSGFPVVWNMVVFTLFVVGASETTASIVVSVSVVMTFLPINFLHPVRVKRLRKLNVAVMVLWSALSIYALLLNFVTPMWVVYGVAAAGFTFMSLVQSCNFCQIWVGHRSLSRHMNVILVVLIRYRSLFYCAWARSEYQCGDDHWAGQGQAIKS